MKMSDIKFPEVGRGAKFLVKRDGETVAGFDTLKEAESYVNMKKNTMRGGKEVSSREEDKASCATKKWTIETN